MNTKNIFKMSLVLTLTILCLSTFAKAQDNDVIYEEEADEIIGLEINTNEDLDFYTDELMAPPYNSRWGFRCVAENIRRQRFTGRGPTMQSARNRAVRNCDYRSAHCRIVRCYRDMPSRIERPERPVRPLSVPSY